MYLLPRIDKQKAVDVSLVPLGRVKHYNASRHKTLVFTSNSKANRTTCTEPRHVSNKFTRDNVLYILVEHLRST